MPHREISREEGISNTSGALLQRLSNTLGRDREELEKPTETLDSEMGMGAIATRNYGPRKMQVVLDK
ncbi:MAG: hypothetical protein AAGD09_12350 [Cyanobacteria bacterium P01_F01_bin.56]